MKRWPIILLLAIVMVLILLRLGFGLVKTENRGYSGFILSSEIKDRIFIDNPQGDYKDAIKYSLRLTSELLRFTEKNNMGEGKANCVGYAQLCSAICNNVLELNNLPYRSMPVVGYVTCLGVNICPILQRIVPKNYKNFVKDHDFVELNTDSYCIYFDASLYDYHLNCTTKRKK